VKQKKEEKKQAETGGYYLASLAWPI